MTRKVEGAAYLDRRSALALGAAALFSPLARAETGEVRIAQGFGVAFLPLTVMKEQRLIEKRATAAGLDVKTSWLQFSGGATMTDAILSDSLDVATAGITPLIKLWAKTRGTLDIRGIASLGSAPMHLNTTNPAVKSIADFTAKDKIALPAVRGSLQAEVLQMAASKLWGIENYAKLDNFTVSMRHPDAMVALLSGGSITAHFANSPFQEKEAEDPRVRRVLSSADVLGGPATVNTIYCSGKFRSRNPKVYAAVVDAFREAIAWINQDKRRAAEFYVASEKSPMSTQFIHNIISAPDYVYSTTPLGVSKYYEFLLAAKLIDVRPSSWKEVFFPEVHGEPGS